MAKDFNFLNPTCVCERHRGRQRDRERNREETGAYGPPFYCYCFNQDVGEQEMMPEER